RASWPTRVRPPAEYGHRSTGRSVSARPSHPAPRHAFPLRPQSRSSVRYRWLSMSELPLPISSLTPGPVPETLSAFSARNVGVRGAGFRLAVTSTLWTPPRRPAGFRPSRLFYPADQPIRAPVYRRNLLVGEVTPRTGRQITQADGAVRQPREPL